MKRKWGILLAAIVLFVLAGILLTSARHRKPMVVVGNLSAQDVAEIRKVVKTDMWGRVFPGFSAAVLKGLAANIGAYMKYDITEISSRSPNRAVVQVENSAMGRQRPCEYGLSKGPGGWKINVIIPSYTLKLLNAAYLPVPVPVTNLPSPESLGNFSPTSLISDRGLTEMRLGPPREQKMREGLTPTYISLNTPRPIPPTSGASLTNLMP